MIDFLYKIKVRKGILLRTPHFFINTVKFIQTINNQIKYAMEYK